MRDLVAESALLLAGPVLCSTCLGCGTEHVGSTPEELPTTCDLCDYPLPQAKEVTPTRDQLRALWEGINERDAAIQTLLKRPATKDE